MKFITFGIVQHSQIACRIIEAANEDTAIATAEDLGNVAGTTIAYSDESLVALADERPDYTEEVSR